MKVCIAEKPSVAADIAKVLGATTRKTGYFEGNGYQVTWTFGHLCTLKQPHEYNEDWKKWKMELLPIFPKKFEIELINDKGVKAQFKIIKELFKKADEIINCGDAGQEGELIQRWVLQLTGAKCPVKRLWISSMTDTAIREGFANLKPQEDYTRLYHAGMTRACADWLLGMNATRLYTMKFGNYGQVLSIGRVQTPTLALLVQRQKEIQKFVPEPYWVLTTKYRGTVFTSSEGKMKDKGRGEQVLKAVEGTPFEITSVVKKSGQEQPKPLFDLTSLQVECNRRFGFSAETTLNTLQKLYEKKLTTYPRVDTTYLPDDVYGKCPDILKGLVAYEEYVSKIDTKKLLKRSRVFDSSKVTYHHAIIPTGVKGGELTAFEYKVYDAIVRRFIAVFMPNCEFSSTTVEGMAGGQKFKASGKEILSPGWRVVMQKAKGEEEDEDNKDDKEVVLPTFVKGEKGEHTPSLAQKMTTAPKEYTEATLLQAMETAGKFVEDEVLRAAMKENGIGRPSSRAGIIETLIKRQYVIRQKKKLIPTRTGMELIDIIKDPMLKSCEMTGQWEKKLRDIERGSYNPGDFIKELDDRISNIIDGVKVEPDKKIFSLAEAEAKKPKRAAASSRSKARSQGTPVEKGSDDLIGKKCPLCGQGHIIKNKYNYTCSRWREGCKFKRSF